MNTLLNAAVIQQLGFDSLQDEDCKQTLSDIANYGIDGGFGSFIYYSDTCEFYDNNERLIKEALAEMACDFGQTAAELVASFGCLNGNYSVCEIDLFLMTGEETDDNGTQLKNALAWFAAEETARVLGGE